jgi:hypothetical protein
VWTGRSIGVALSAKTGGCGGKISAALHQQRSALGAWREVQDRLHQQHLRFKRIRHQQLRFSFNNNVKAPSGFQVWFSA